ncbi:MAG: aspartate-semialdehyde dehydrogenase [Planctomycetota bacterium]
MSLKDKRVIVVGATGAVGRECLSILAQRGVPAGNIVALASARSAGITIPYASGGVTVAELNAQAFNPSDVAIFCATSGVARQWVPLAVERGATVVDNSSAFRMRDDVPLVIPEINPVRAGKVIANPNCSTIIMLVALEPLRKAFGVESIVVSTYQAVSGAGQAGIDALQREVAGDAASGPFAEPCAFNVFSHNSAMDPATGLNGEEQKMIDESRKIWNQPDLEVIPTCVRVPVYRAHSESICVRLTQPATESQIRAAYADARGVRVVDDRAANAFPTPLKASGRDDVLVGRIRPAVTGAADQATRTWCLWACGDQLRKGAALNAVQVAEGIA